MLRARAQPNSHEDARTMNIDSYVQLAGYLGIAGLLGMIAVGIPQLLSPRYKGEKTDSTYECGVETIGNSWMRFSIAFYVFALIFVAFEVDILYLFPVALAYDTVPGIRPFVELLIFLFILTLAIVYAWRKKVFTWQIR